MGPLCKGVSYCRIWGLVGSFGEELMKQRLALAGQLCDGLAQPVPSAERADWPQGQDVTGEKPGAGTFAVLWLV